MKYDFTLIVCTTLAIILIYLTDAIRLTKQVRWFHILKVYRQDIMYKKVKRIIRLKGAVLLCKTDKI